MNRTSLLAKILCFSLFILGIQPALKAQKDTIPPVITLTDNDTNCIPIGSVWLPKDPIVTDNQSAKTDILMTYTWENPNGPVNTLKIGTYIMVIEATDSNGNKATRKVRYNVGDCFAPVIDLNTKDTVCVKWRTPYNSVAPIATDNYYSKNQISLVRKSTNVNSNIMGVYEEVFEAVDGSGNVSTKTRIVVVKEDCDANSTTSLDLPAFMQVNIYPNPAQDLIAVELTDIHTLEPLTLLIISADGKQVYTSKIGKDMMLDISQFPNGMYAIQVRGANMLFNKLLVIQH